MMNALLGLPLTVAQDILRAEGQEQFEIIETAAPRGNSPRGTLRVVRICEQEKKLVCARFSDEILKNSETDDREDS